MTDTKLIVNTGDLPAGLFSGADIAPHSFRIFQPPNEEIMRLDKDGMVFLGQRITDAGEAYAAWMKTMETMAMMQGESGMSKQETIEDARLRDSAPDLLEALQVLAEHDFGATGWTPLLERAAIKGRAAIRKATGE